MKGESSTTEEWVACASVACLEQDRLARAIVDLELKLRWANPAGAALMSDRNGLELRTDTLRAAETAENEKLSTLVRQAGTEVSSCCLEKPDRLGHLLVRAQRLANLEPFAVALVLVDAGSAYRPVYRDLDRAFGLTQGEHRVLLSLLDGKEAEALSRISGLSIETRRSHIRSIYTKLDVNSRERLFYKVQPFRL